MKFKKKEINLYYYNYFKLELKNKNYKQKDPYLQLYIFFHLLIKYKFSKFKTIMTAITFKNKIAIIKKNKKF